MNNELNQGASERPVKSLGDVLSSMIQQLETGSSAIAGQIREVNKVSTASAERVASNSSAASSSRASVSRELLNAFNPVSSSRGTNILTSLFLGPVWKGLFSLFGGGSETAQAPLQRFAFPEDTRTDRAASINTNGQAGSVRTDAFGLSQTNVAQQTPINISIQALDARSILDRSDDIAAALKQAMLSNHEINDSMSEL
ncbi:MAG: hypothetical protein FJW36_01375 [Acidobacteria bacterium]|nr:hypothetical protein [Acidobacteriota bacterium]